MLKVIIAQGIQTAKSLGDIFQLEHWCFRFSAHSILFTVSLYTSMPCILQKLYIDVMYITKLMWEVKDKIACMIRPYFPPK